MDPTASSFLESSQTLIHIMQASIAPVTLISGVGLLILSMTNRYGRVIDRTRDQLRVLTRPHVTQDVDKVDEHHLRRQIRILYRRAEVMRTALFCSIGSIFFTSLSICLIFVQLTFGNDLTNVSKFSFLAALVLLVAGMGLYVLDIKYSLAALKLEIRAGDEDLI